MNKTKIEWVKNPDGSQGYTWNPITGCLNGCEYCYARKLANGRLRSSYLANHNIVLDNCFHLFGHVEHKVLQKAMVDPFYPRFWNWRALEPRDSSRGKGIFVCDMSDLFGIGIPEEWTKRVLKEIPICHNNRFYLLTKQPQNLARWSPFPDNCWVGVTATDGSALWIALTIFKCIKAKVKYISFEPLLGEIKTYPEIFGNFHPDPPVKYISDNLKEAGVSWVIIGAQTKPYKPPKIEWVNEIIEACDKANIPVFLKNNLLDGNQQIIAQLVGKKLRQELPNVS